MDYRDTLAAMLEYCKKSGKRFIFIALAMDVYNKRETIEKSVPAIQGSMKDKLASHFTYVYYADAIETDDLENHPLGIRYVFRTNRTSEKKDIECKTPMGLHVDSDGKALDVIDNDVAMVLETIQEYQS